MNGEDRECDFLTLNEHKFERSPRPSCQSGDNAELEALRVVTSSNNGMSCDGFRSDSPITCQISSSETDRPSCEKQYNSQPPNYLGLALIVSLCNCPLGGIGVLCAILSRQHYDMGDLEGSKCRGQAAKWLSITGFVTTCMIIVFVMVYKFVILPNVIDRIDFS